MKAIMIIYNQALTEKVEYMLEKLNVRGFTQWPLVYGSGSNTGEPRMGTHTWPEMNSSLITIVNDEMVDEILDKVKKMDAINNEIGIRAFVWNVEKMA
ncbi:MAG TPA: P-II family nitrogen regulator [Bacteroidales bacterium]|nr:P-II family nitrogen regulator [Bacteroidales bacterium]